MFIVIGIMFFGVGVGYLLRRVPFSRVTGSSISYTIYLLLFLLGISVGSNRTIVDNIASLGGEALLIASAATLGSLSMAWVVYSLFFKERRRG